MSGEVSPASLHQAHFHVYGVLFAETGPLWPLVFTFPLLLVLHRLRYDEKGLGGYNAKGEPYILMDPKLGLPSASGEGAGIDTVAYFSAYGPTKDGRIKPEVVAPGDRVSGPRTSLSLSCRH